MKINFEIANNRAEISLDKNEMTFCMSEKGLQEERLFMLLDHEMIKKGYARLWKKEYWVYDHYEKPVQYKFEIKDTVRLLVGFDVVMERVK